jgi:hypothetical protein
LEQLPIYVAEEAAIPVRAAQSDASEMVTQLLWGEGCHVHETDGSWSRISTAEDAYEGWVDSKMIGPASWYGKVSRWLFVFEGSVLLADGTSLRLPAGARVPLFDAECPECPDWQLSPLSDARPEQDRSCWVETAGSFRNAPYLWGGRCSFGIDCSGLIQVSARICGLRLPRDARDQAKVGTEVAWEERQRGDLLFFSRQNSGPITHVGILEDTQHILHASGKVRRDKVHPSGIVHSTTGQLTHHFICIRRC